MINRDCAQMINAHLPLELKAQHTYLHFALTANTMGYFGVETYFNAASTEEAAHLRKLLAFLNDYDMMPEIPAIDAIPSGGMDIRSMFVQALAIEQTVSASFNAILDCADDDCKDFQVVGFIQDMQNKQTSGEIEIRDIINRFDMSGSNMPAFDEYVGELAT